MLVFPTYTEFVSFVFSRLIFLKGLAKLKQPLLRIQHISTGIHPTGLRLLCGHCPCACSYFPTAQGNLPLGELMLSCTRLSLCQMVRGHGQPAHKAPFTRSGGHPG